MRTDGQTDRQAGRQTVVTKLIVDCRNLRTRLIWRFRRVYACTQALKALRLNVEGQFVERTHIYEFQHSEVDPIDSVKAYVRGCMISNLTTVSSNSDCITQQRQAMGGFTLQSHLREGSCGFLQSLWANCQMVEPTVNLTTTTPFHILSKYH